MASCSGHGWGGMLWHLLPLELWHVPPADSKAEPRCLCASRWEMVCSVQAQIIRPGHPSHFYQTSQPLARELAGICMLGG